MKVLAAMAKNPPARRYCFKASCRLLGAGGRVLGTFSGYDKTFYISESVAQTCAQHECDGQVCSPVQLCLLDVCPCESTGEVTTVML